MDFLKKWFGGKKDNTETPSSASHGETFTCENCGEERSLSQKKEHMASEGGNTKNVCEFC